MHLCTCEWKIMCLHKSQEPKDRMWRAELPRIYMGVGQC